MIRRTVGLLARSIGAVRGLPWHTLREEKRFRERLHANQEREAREAEQPK